LRRNEIDDYMRQQATAQAAAAAAAQNPN